MYFSNIYAQNDRDGQYRIFTLFDLIEITVNCLHLAFSHDKTRTACIICSEDADSC